MNLFVYGSLKTGHCRSHLLNEQKFIKNIRTKSGYQIYNCGTFPGLVKEQSDFFVEGELWDVDESFIPVLDRVEGAPYLYKLQNIELDGETAYSYLWQKETKDLSPCGPNWSKELE